MDNVVLMDNSTQQFVYEALMIIIGVAITAASGYASIYLHKKTTMDKYGFDQEAVERILDNAVHYSESVASKLSKIGAESADKKLSSIEKLRLARTYINKVEPSLISKYGDTLDVMITRKVSQTINK